MSSDDPGVHQNHGGHAKKKPPPQRPDSPVVRQDTPANFCYRQGPSGCHQCLCSPKDFERNRGIEPPDPVTFEEHGSLKKVRERVDEEKEEVAVVSTIQE